MIRKMIFIFISVFVFGCEVGQNKPEERKTKNFPEAPEIISINQYIGTTKSGSKHWYLDIEWTPINEALAYTLLCSNRLDSTFAECNFGRPKENGRSSIYHSEQGEGIIYYRVLARNAANQPGDTSDIYPNFYKGFYNP